MTSVPGRAIAVHEFERVEFVLLGNSCCKAEWPSPRAPVARDGRDLVHACRVGVVVPDQPRRAVTATIACSCKGGLRACPQCTEMVTKFALLSHRSFHALELGQPTPT